MGDCFQASSFSRDIKNHNREYWRQNALQSDTMATEDAWVLASSCWKSAQEEGRSVLLIIGSESSVWPRHSPSFMRHNFAPQENPRRTPLFRWERGPESHITLLRRLLNKHMVGAGFEPRQPGEPGRRTLATSWHPPSLVGK